MRYVILELIKRGGLYGTIYILSPLYCRPIIGTVHKVRQAHRGWRVSAKFDNVTQREFPMNDIIHNFQASQKNPFLFGVCA